METTYTCQHNGFSLRVDMSVYSRPAVMKALYKWTDRYAIAYSRDYGQLLVEFECLNKGLCSPLIDAKNALNSLSFEMMRWDVMKRTSVIRELLVGRALYATCIETDQGDVSMDLSDDNWESDSQEVLQSWQEEKD